MQISAYESALSLKELLFLLCNGLMLLFYFFINCSLDSYIYFLSYQFPIFSPPSCFNPYGLLLVCCKSVTLCHPVSSFNFFQHTLCLYLLGFTSLWEFLLKSLLKKGCTWAKSTFLSHITWTSEYKILPDAIFSMGSEGTAPKLLVAVSFAYARVISLCL